jgi:hypothetical protein
MTLGIINMFASIEYKQDLETKMAGFQEKIADPAAERATRGVGILVHGEKPNSN